MGVVVSQCRTNTARVWEIEVFVPVLGSIMSPNQLCIQDLGEVVHY